MKGKLLGVAVLSALTVIGTTQFVLKPAAESYAQPMIQEQLNNALNGQVTFSSMRIDWMGTATLKDVVVNDEHNARVMGAPEVSVALSPFGAVKGMITGDGTIGIISKVTVTKPDIHLWEYEDGTWNVAKILKSDRSQSKSTFKGDVVVDDGIAYARTFKGRQIQAEEINGALQFNEYPMIKGAFTTLVDKQQIVVSGEYKNVTGAPFDVTVKADSIDLNYVNDFIPKDVKASLVSGKLKDATIRVQRDNDQYRLHGNFDVANVNGYYEEYNLTNLNSHVVFDNQLVNIVGAKGAINDQNLQINGTIDISNTDTGLNLHVESSSIEPNRLYASVPTEGTVKVDAYILGTAINPKLHGYIATNNLVYEGYAVKSNKLEFTYDNDVITVPTSTISIGNGTVTANGWYNIKMKDFEGYAESTTLPMDLINNLTNQNISGNLSGKVYAIGKNGRLSNIVGTVHGEHVIYKDITFDTVDAMFTGSGVNYTIDYINGKIGEGTLTGYGTIENNENIHMTLSGHNMPLNQLSGIAGYELEGKANINATVEGSIQAPIVKGNISSAAGSVDKLHFDQAYTDFTYEGDKVHLDRAVLQDGNGSYNLSGDIKTDGSRFVDLNVGLNNVRVENTIQSFTDLPITGWLTTMAHVVGPLDNPTVNGYLHMWDGSAYGKLITDVTSDYTYANGVLTIPNLVAQAYTSTITASGTASKEAINISFNGNNVSLGPLFHQFTDKFTGLVDMRGTITGSFVDPELHATVTSDAVHINTSNVHNVNGEILANKRVVHLESLSFAEGTEGWFTVTGGIRLNQNNALYGKATATKGSISNIISLVGLNVPNLDGSLNGEINLGGTLENPAFDVYGAVVDTKIGNRVFGTSRIDAELNQRRLNIKTLEVPVDNGVVAAAGTADFDGEADIQVVAKDVPILDLIPLTGKEIDASGMLNIIANITGKTQNPHVELSGELTDGQLNGVAIDKAIALATMDDKVINLNQLLLTKSIYSVKAFGKIPLASIMKNEYAVNAAKSNSMDLTIDVNNADFGIIPFFTSYISTSSGDLSGLIKVTGTVDEPKANGSIAVKDGSMHIKRIRDNFERINAQIIFKDNVIDITGSGAMGKGSANVNGRILWGTNGIVSTDLTVNSTGLEINSDYFRGPLNAQFNIKQNGDIPKITGEIDLQNNTLNIPFTFESGESPSNIAFDVSVKAGENVKLYNSLLYDFTLNGEARFLGTTSHPRSDGEFNVTKGYVKYLNTKFNITTGKAKFNPGSFLPYLMANGEARLSTYRIFADVNGTVDKMEIKLTSEPQLTEQQIIHLLTFRKGGKMSSSVTSEDANAFLTASLQMFALGSIQERLENSIGLDVLNISSGSLDQKDTINRETAGYYNVELGKYLLPNLLVRVSKGINYDYVQYGMEYELGSKFSLNGWKNNRDNGFIGGQWHYTF